MEYTVVVKKAPNGMYISSCPAVPEAHSQGETCEESLINIREAIELAQECRKERGEIVPAGTGCL